MSTEETQEAVRDADQAAIGSAPNTVFPSEIKIPSGATLCQYGLTKREWFAGLAMQGFIAGEANGDPSPAEDVATVAVMHADALIAALEARHDN